MLDQLGPGRRAGGKIEEQRIGRQRKTVRCEVRRRRIAVAQLDPAFHRFAAADARDRSGNCFELLDKLALDDHKTRFAYLHPVLDFVRRELRRCRQHDCAQLHRSKHNVPQLDAISEHQQNAIAALDTEITQEIGNPR